MTDAWHIDALDSRGGLCFAALRPSDLLVDDGIVDQPSVYIAAPSFVPEAVSGRAVGFAATRSTFQLGLFARDAEVPFASLDALVEFVRRAYLSSGGGDGGSGFGPAPPPSPGPEPLDLEPWEQVGESDDFKPLRQSGQHMSSLSEKLDIPHYSPTNFGFAAGKGKWNARRGLARGIALVMCEMLRRAPAATADQSRADWLEAAARLGNAADRLGLWPAILLSTDAAVLVEAADRVTEEAKWLPRRRQMTPDSSKVWLLELFGILPTPLPEIGNRLWRYVPSKSRRPPDPFDDLAQWPMPPGMEHLSLRDLLMAYVGAPQTLSSCADPHNFMFLVLFSVCHVQPGSRIATENLTDPPHAIVIDALVARALEWLERQLPKYAYAPALEAMIAAAGDPSS